MNIEKIEQITKAFSAKLSELDALIIAAKQEALDNKILYITAEANFRESLKKLSDTKRKIYTLQLEFDNAINNIKNDDNYEASERIRRVQSSRYRSKSCGSKTIKKLMKK